MITNVSNMIRLKTAASFVVLACLGFLTWAVLRDQRREVSWASAEAPDYAVAGQTFPIRVTVNEPVSDVFLDANLHWFTEDQEPRGFLSETPQQQMQPGKTIYTFQIPVPNESGLAYVSGIIFSTTTGRWQNRTQVARTSQILVKADVGASNANQLHHIDLYENFSDSTVVPAYSPAIRASTSVVWLICGIGEWWRRDRSATSARKRGDHRHAGYWLIFACLAAALWEFSEVESFIGSYGRFVALEYGVYYERRWFQKALSLAIAFCVAALALAAVRRPKILSTNLAVVGLGCFAGTSLLSALSLHHVDKLLAIHVFSIPVVQVLKLIAAFIALTGIWNCFRIERRKDAVQIDA